MNTPHGSRRAPNHGVSTSRIPRPSKNAHTDADMASPALDRGTKRRHVSEPESQPGKKPNTGEGELTVKANNEMDEHVKIADPADQHMRPDNNHENQLQVPPLPHSSSKPAKDISVDSQEKPRRRSKHKDGVKRRSSFVHGRISKVHPALTIADISLDIPVDLSAEERLSRLTSAVAQSALEKVSEEFKELDGMQQFKVKAQDVIDIAVSRLQADETFQKTTDTSLKDGFLPNPVNESNSRGIEDLQAYTERLKREFERWRELLEERTQQDEQAKRALDEVAEHPIVERPTVGLTAQERFMLDNRPNLNAKLKTLHTHRETVTLAVSMHIQAFRQLRTFQEDASKFLEQQALGIYQTTVKTSDSPRKLISSVIEYKD